MDGFHAERSSAQIDITDCSEYSTGDGTMGRPSAVAKGLVTSYKRLRAAYRLEAMATKCTSVERKDGTGSGYHAKMGSVKRKI